MKLRNKKTGEIAEPFGIKCINGRTFVQFDDGKGTFKFEARSLAKLNEEWEDYEEPKEYWCVDCDGMVLYEKDENDDYDIGCRKVGNYFETKEEAEKAVEKLRAWKRLKDRGLRIDDWYVYPKFGHMTVIFKINDINDVVDILKKGERDKDLDLIFGENNGETDS